MLWLGSLLEAAQRATAKAKAGEADERAKLAEADARAVQSEREIARLNEQLAERKRIAERQRADYQAALEICRGVLNEGAGLKGRS